MPVMAAPPPQIKVIRKKYLGRNPRGPDLNNPLYDSGLAPLVGILMARRDRGEHEDFMARRHNTEHEG